MIIGIGVDIVKISRIAASLKRFGDKFAEKILTTEEYAEYSQLKNQTSFVAKRFAAKEATVKALGTGLRHGIALDDIGVGHDALGKPELYFRNAAAKLIKQKQIKATHISLSDEKDHAIAMVVLEGGDSNGP